MTVLPKSSWIRGWMTKHLLSCLIFMSITLQLSQSAPAIEDEDQGGCYYMFNHYGEGDRILTNEPCLNCTCHNSMLMCYLRVCPFTRPIGQDCTIEKKADQCCPVITCPEVPVSLLTSTPSLITSSTTTPSSASNSALIQSQRGCEMGDKYYSDGTQVDLDLQKPCELCYCIRNRTACVMQECILHVEGCEPEFEAGVCCPVRYRCQLQIGMETTTTTLTGLVTSTVSSFFLSTPTPHPGGCYRDGDFYHDGSQIPTPGEAPCEHCYCMRGEIVCAVQECGSPLEGEGQNCTAIPPRTGLCCPEKYACQTSSLEPTTSVSPVVFPLTDISILTSTQSPNVTDGGQTRLTTVVADTGLTTRRYEMTASQDIQELTSAAGESSTSVPERDTTMDLLPSSSPSLHDEEQLLENEVESKGTTVPVPDKHGSGSEEPQELTQSVSGAGVEGESDKASSFYAEATTVHLDILTDQPHLEHPDVGMTQGTGEKAVTEQVLPETTQSSPNIQNQSQLANLVSQKPGGSAEAESTTAPSLATSAPEQTESDKKAEDEDQNELEGAVTAQAQSTELGQTVGEADKERPGTSTTQPYDSDSQSSSQESASHSTESVQPQTLHDHHPHPTTSPSNPTLTTSQDSELPTSSGMEPSSAPPGAPPGLVSSLASVAGLLPPFNTSEAVAVSSTGSATVKEVLLSSDTTEPDEPMTSSSYEEQSTVPSPAPTSSSAEAGTETSASVAELSLTTSPSSFGHETVVGEKLEKVSPVEVAASVTEQTSEDGSETETQGIPLPTSKLTGVKDGSTPPISIQTSTQSLFGGGEHLEESGDVKIKETLVTTTESLGSTEAAGSLDSSHTVPVFSGPGESSESPEQKLQDGVAHTTMSSRPESATSFQKPSQPPGDLHGEPTGTEQTLSVTGSWTSTAELESEDLSELSKPASTLPPNASTQGVAQTDVGGSSSETPTETTERVLMDGPGSPDSSGEDRTSSSVGQSPSSSLIGHTPSTKLTTDLQPTQSPSVTPLPGNLLATEASIVPEDSVTTTDSVVPSNLEQVVEQTPKSPTLSGLQVSVQDSETTQSPTELPSPSEHGLETVQADEEEHVTDKLSPAPESHNLVEDSESSGVPGQTSTKVSSQMDKDIWNTPGTTLPSAESPSQTPTESEPNVGIEKELSSSSIPGDGAQSTQATSGHSPDLAPTTEGTEDLKPSPPILPVFSTESSKRPLEEATAETGTRTTGTEQVTESIAMRNGSVTPSLHLEEQDESEATLSPSTFFPDSSTEEQKGTRPSSNVSSPPSLTTTQSSKESDETLDGSTQSAYSSPASPVGAEASQGPEFHESTTERETKEDAERPETSESPGLQFTPQTVEFGGSSQPKGTDQSTTESIATGASVVPMRPSVSGVTIASATQASLTELEGVATTSGLVQDQVGLTEESGQPGMKPANLMSPQTQLVASTEKDESGSRSTGQGTTSEYELGSSTEKYSDGIGSFPTSSEEEPASTTQSQNYPRIPGEGSCFVEGVTYPNGSRIPPSTSCQIACACQNSIVHCLLVHCPAPPSGFGDCKPVYTPNKCCPKYSCNETSDHSVTVTPESVQAITTASLVTVTSEALPSDGVSSNLVTGEQKLDEKLPSTPESINKESTTAIPQSDEVHSPSLVSADQTTQSSSTESITIRTPTNGSAAITEKPGSSTDTPVETHPTDLASTMEPAASSTPPTPTTNSSVSPSSVDASETGTTLKYPVTFSTTSTTASPAAWPFPASSVSPSAPSNGACLFDARVYMSAQQIPRDDPCDFCFCFRGDIICLQQSCPPPIPGCYEEPIPGFCCPRYECPVGNGNSTAPPLFPPSYYHNQMGQSNSTQSSAPPSLSGSGSGHGCEIQGEYYDAGQLVTDTSGPCLECRCGQAGIMECDPRECQPEPMLRKMIEAITSR